LGKTVLAMITGLPGAGKSTFAVALAEKLNARHLNTDRIRNQLGKRGQYDPATKERVYQEMLRQTEETLKEGQPVVVDGTFYQHKLRQTFIDLAERLNCDIRWIEIRAEEATIRRRLKSERLDSEADFQVYLNIKAIYEPLNFGHLVLWSDQLSVAEMTERALDFIMLRA
jgi:predicted kinase